MENAKRTCSIYIGVGTAADGQFRVFNYNARNVDIYDPTTRAYGPHIEDVVYRSTNSFVIKSSDQLWGVFFLAVDQTCFSNQLQSMWGNLTAQNAMKNIMSVAETGNLRANLICHLVALSSHVIADLAVYDFSAQQMYVANAASAKRDWPYQCLRSPVCAV